LTTSFVTGLSAIRDQDKAVRRLTGLLHTGNIPNALLFTGIDGIGKKKAAIAFAMALNCLRAGNRRTADEEAPSPCGRCRQCKKIASGNHPDVIVVEPERFRIRISQIRDLSRMLAVKPYEARQRAVIIDQAQAMNTEAGNSLLKLLEEPPERTFLVLTAGHTYDLLPTIVSRCQHIRFNPIPEPTLVEYLENRGILHGEAEILGRLANGSFEKAASLVDTGWIDRRKWIIRTIEPQDTDRNSPRRIGPLMAFSEKLSRDGETLTDALEIMKSWLRDLAVVRTGSDKIVNRDMLNQLRQAARHDGIPSLLSKIEAIEAAQRKIENNANVRLTLDVMMMNIV